MKSFMHNPLVRTTIILGVLLLALFLNLSPHFVLADVPVGPFTPSAPSGSSSPYNISGWTWSENMGWFSWNSTSDGSATVYGANVDTTNRASGGTGNMSGNVWSEYLGWISFDRANTNNPPSAPFNGGSGPIAQVNWSNGKVTGWVRALVGCEVTPGTPVSSCAGSGAGAAAGGWDGWIKLSDDSVGIWNGKGVKVSANRFGGWAWASDVIGWIDFNPKLANIELGPTISVPPCNVNDVPENGWGACQPITQCTAPPATLTNQPGVQVGVCAEGGTVVRSCNIAIQTCTALPSGGSCGDGVCDRAGGETLLNCSKDCKGKVIQF